jgi:transcriptional regulator with XRE-family HTH domain
MVSQKTLQKKAKAPADDVGQSLCRRVKELRKRRGWTLEEMSAACAVSRSMLSEIERHRANPTLAVAFRIAQALGMSLGELVEAPAATRVSLSVGSALPDSDAVAAASGEVGGVLRDRPAAGRGAAERGAFFGGSGTADGATRIGARDLARRCGRFAAWGLGALSGGCAACD